ncbi:hypothetical protein EDB81DRAFT_758361 [Dactylonectria macrodidyma]|uniref:Helicase C-terminal domain-containing protein n=1 Tax=Dactylonectria macrodidyma TaxID=307937 RepID=A0A9P9F741_9HYPO|nr:hypothetical protein EDB81DRAFT_758361 [Dactylonectria macrodidyma]
MRTLHFSSAQRHMMQTSVLDQNLLNFINHLQLNSLGMQGLVFLRINVCSLDLSSDSRFWGCKTRPCPKVHTISKEFHFKNLYCVELGRHDFPVLVSHYLDIEETDGDKFSMCDYWLAAVALGDQEPDDVFELGYVVKLPGVDKPIKLNGRLSWTGMIGKISHMMRKDSSLWCPSSPPVILFCTPSQAERCAKRGWIDSVRFEYELTHQQEKVPAPTADIEAPVDSGAGVENADLSQGFSEENGSYLEDDDAIDQVWVDSTILGNDREYWKQACIFFHHDQSQVDTGIQLPGMALELYPYQMVDVYKTLSICFSADTNGIFNCSQPGLGKTIESLATSCVIALAFMSREHCRNHPKSHKVKRSGTCQMGDAFGISCYCTLRSLTRQICRVVSRRPQLIICPAGIVKQWINASKQFLAERVVLRNGEVISELPLLVTAYYEEAEIKSGGNTPVSQALWTQPVAIKGELEGHETFDETLWESLQEVTLGDAMDALRFLGVTVETVNNNAKLPGTNVTRDRLILVCSTSIASSKAFPAKFKTSIHVRQHGSSKKRELTITGALCPSVVHYDEFTYGKGKDTNIVNLLKQFCTVGGSKSGNKPLIVLLSATPMPRGPQDLEGLLPLTSTHPDIRYTIDVLKLAYIRAFNSDEVESETDKIADWRRVSAETLGRCMFHRWFGMQFLDGFIPDPRPACHIKVARFFPVLSVHEEKLAEVQQSLRDRLEQLSAPSAGGSLSKLRKTAEFRLSLQCSVLPSYILLNQAELDGVRNNASAVRAIVAREIANLGCAQLDALQEIVREVSVEGKVRHGLVFSSTPISACIAAEWLKHKLAPNIYVKHFTALEVKPAHRAKMIKELNRHAIEHPNCPIVVVSTYALMATGLDRIQDFASYVVKLGEPWTNKEHQQCQGRVHRKGQKHPVYIHSLHGAVGSLDYEFFRKNRKALNLLSEDAILSSFLERNPLV